MSKIYACIASSESKKDLVAVAQAFAYNIELLDDAVLFDLTGTENLFGDAAQTAEKIYDELKKKNLSGNVSIASNAASALLYARNQKGVSIVGDTKSNLPLDTLGIDPDTLAVFHVLGLKTTDDLSQISEDELVARYGLEFRDAIDLAKNCRNYILTPNLKENKVAWATTHDFTVANFERLVFILTNGLGKVLDQTAYFGFSTERLEIELGLDDKTTKFYEIKLSFPTLDKKFWLTIINLRIADDAPEAEIVSVRLVSHFSPPRSVQRGLFSSTKPEPESLQLTVDKIKNLLGKENVGVPVLLDRRLPKPFALEAGRLPFGAESLEIKDPKPVLSLNYFNPPLPADVTANKGRLLYLRTRRFAGRVKEYGGFWKGFSGWWNPLLRWQTREWDVELENQSLYRLQKNARGWFVIGEYD
jgi:hypothetical protein